MGFSNKRNNGIHQIAITVLKDLKNGNITIRMTNGN